MNDLTINAEPAEREIVRYTELVHAGVLLAIADLSLVAEQCDRDLVEHEKDWPPPEKERTKRVRAEARAAVRWLRAQRARRGAVRTESSTVASG